MNELSKQLDGVNAPADSPPQESELELDDPSPSESESKPDEVSGEKTDGKDKDVGDDRPVQNLQREFDRKMQKLERDITTRLDNMSQQMISSIQQTQQPSQQGATLDDWSVDQLRNYRSQVDEKMLPEYDRYLIQRENQEYIQQQVSKIKMEQSAEFERQKWNQLAVSRYPALKDESSEFHQKVNMRLNELGKEYLRNPRAILDAANDVAIEGGFAMHASSTQRKAPRPPASGKGKPAPKDNEAEPSMSEERSRYIASRLKMAMPEGKDFDTKAIRKRAEEYKGYLNRKPVKEKS